MLALSVTVAYLHYYCQAQKSRITNMKAIKSFAGREKDQVSEREIELNNGTIPEILSGWGGRHFAWTAFESQLGKALNYYYHCGKMNLIFRLVFAYSLSDITYAWLKKKNTIGLSSRHL